MYHATSALLDSKLFHDFAELMGDDLAMILGRHIEVSQGYLASIREGVATQNAKLVAQAAHPLKSSSYQIGATRVGDIAKSLEHLAKSDTPDMAQIAALAQEMELAQHATCEALAPHLAVKQARQG
jgi:HPt (histidine-containing phosphotransfer) domain-containing protein